MSAKGKIIWGACQREGSPENFLKLDSLKRHFLRSLDRISLHMTGMIIRFQLYELHK